MSTHNCVRRIQFCAGHRVFGHENKCSNPHGHNYVAFFHARGALDHVGRVIDFSVLKETIGGWIEENWDHAFIYYWKDNSVKTFLAENGFKGFLMNSNPTAENMVQYLLDYVCPNVLKNAGVEIFRIELWETENCCALAHLR